MMIYDFLTVAVIKDGIIRGGVEDTRLEAKDTKNIRGQDQGEGQTLLRLRVGMLEAKAKDTGASGHTHKKRSSKFFSGDLQKKVLKNFFSSNLPNEENKKNLCKFFARFLAFSNKILTV